MRVRLPKPKTKYDRIFSFPIISKTVTHEEFDAKATAKSAFLGALTGGISFLFGADNTTRTVSEQILVRAQVFDQFMQLDDNFQTARPADCIRVMRFKVGSITIAGMTIPFAGPDFFENGPQDKAQWAAYAAILGYSGDDGLYQMLDYYFAGKLVSEWEQIFNDSIAPKIFHAFIDSLSIEHLLLDFNPPTYSGGERILDVAILGTTGLSRIQFPLHIKLSCASDGIKALMSFVTLNIERLILGYSTPHFEGYLFQGSLRDDILDGTSLYIPVSSEEKRNRARRIDTLPMS